MNIVLSAFNAKFAHSCLALHSLRAHCDRDDLVSVAEYTINMPLLRCLDDMVKRQPDVLLLSTYIWNVDRTIAFARELSKILPAVRIFLGGPEADTDAYGMLDAHEWVEGIFIGEGEETFSEFVGRLAQGEEAPDVDGLLRRNRPFRRRPFMDLSRLRFAYEGVDPETLRNRLAYYESSRGCPFSCAYCLSGSDCSTRFKPLEQVRRELVRMVALPVQTVKFVDRTFNVDHERACALFRFIRELRDLHVCFHFEVSPDLFTEELFEVLEGMPVGRVQLEVGLQSTNRKTLKQCRRKSDPAGAAHVIRRLVGMDNMHVHLDLIAGLPHEGFESFLNSIEDALAMRPHRLQIGFLKLLKGSFLYEQRKKLGIICQDDAPYEVLQTDWLDFTALGRIRSIEQAVDDYYNHHGFPHARLLLPWTDPEGPARFFERLQTHDQRLQNRVKRSERKVRALWNTYGTRHEQDADCTSECIRELLVLDTALQGPRTPVPAFLSSDADASLRCDKRFWSWFCQGSGGDPGRSAHKRFRVLSLRDETLRQMRRMGVLSLRDRTCDSAFPDDCGAAQTLLVLDFETRCGVFGLPRAHVIHRHG